jgi:hypothetical protein
VKNYEIGQIIFLLSKEALDLYPVRVIEETITKSLHGEEKKYVVEYANESGKGTIITLPTKKFSDFSSLEDAREHMIINATAAIEKICLSALKWKENVFDKKEVEDISLNESAVQILNKHQEKNISTDVVQRVETVLLEDGTVAKVHMPNLGAL